MVPMYHENPLVGVAQTSTHRPLLKMEATFVGNVRLWFYECHRSLKLSFYEAFHMQKRQVRIICLKTVICFGWITGSLFSPTTTLSVEGSKSKNSFMYTIRSKYE